jgi:diaminopimelate decarboxylase
LRKSILKRHSAIALAQQATMDHFLYRDGVLHAEDVPVAEIAAAVGTPFYVYSTATLTGISGCSTRRCRGRPPGLLRDEGGLQPGDPEDAGASWARGWTWSRAANTARPAAGVPGDRIVFSGVGKTRAEMRMALEGGIRQFNVESEPEMRRCPRSRCRWASRPITVRVNPDVDAKTHEKIATGKKSRTSSASRSPRARGLCRWPRPCRGSKVVGIDVHIGSQLTDLAPFEAAYPQGRGPDPSAARRRPRDHAGSISAAGWAFPMPAPTRRRRCRRITAR